MPSELFIQPPLIATPAPLDSLASAEEMAYLLALLRIPGFGSRTVSGLMAYFGSARAAWEAPDSGFSGLLPASKIGVFLQRRQELSPQALLESYQAANVHLLPLWDAAYPQPLREIHNPPLLLFLRGNPAALSGKTLAVVGTRKMSDYGAQATRTILEQLAPAGVTIISGLAAGIDTIAHATALETGLPTVAVFGCGLDTVFPKQNKRLAEEIVAAGGALVSEYPFGIQPDRQTFPRRNRIVAGLSAGTFVMEGDVKSGAMITAKYALDEGRVVYALPGNIFSPGSGGPLWLIKQGAVVVTNGQDILLDQGWGEVARTKLEADSPFQSELPEGDEGRILAMIGFDPLPIDALTGRCGLPAAKLNELLTMLELSGHIRTLPGNRVSRC